jgi:hypothetical protein
MATKNSNPFSAKARRARVDKIVDNSVNPKAKAKAKAKAKPKAVVVKVKPKHAADRKARIKAAAAADRRAIAAMKKKK